MEYNGEHILGLCTDCKVFEHLKILLKDITERENHDITLETIYKSIASIKNIFAF